ncbi:MAG: flagellar motor switch protein FliG [Treponema sp.]|jgi:flagellar motor switch protein FliG|nr:flagellar motor switch protein FliG [Treponema sp.]
MGVESSPGAAGFFKAAPAEPRIRRIAKFLVLIGSDRAAEILSRLETSQVERISKEIASLPPIGPGERGALFEEFHSLLSSGSFTGAVSGGVETARRLLHAVYGPEKGEAVLVRAVPEAKRGAFAFLEDFSGEQLALLLQEESPAAAALVLAQLSPRLSAAVLAGMTGGKKLEVVRRVARQAPVSPEVLTRVAEALREKARHMGSAPEPPGFSGMNALAAILKSADPRFGQDLLQELEETDPDLGRDLKDRIYTLDDIVYAADIPLQKKLASMDNREILFLLKARPGDEGAAFRAKILGNLSLGRRNDVLEEGEITGPVPRREVNEAAAAFLGWFRRSREDGALIMTNDEDLIR